MLVWQFMLTHKFLSVFRSITYPRTSGVLRNFGLVVQLEQNFTLKMFVVLK